MKLLKIILIVFVLLHFGCFSFSKGIVIIDDTKGRAENKPSGGTNWYPSYLFGMIDSNKKTGTKSNCSNGTKKTILTISPISYYMEVIAFFLTNGWTWVLGTIRANEIYCAVEKKKHGEVVQIQESSQNFQKVNQKSVALFRLVDGPGITKEETKEVSDFIKEEFKNLGFQVLSGSDIYRLTNLEKKILQPPISPTTAKKIGLLLPVKYVMTGTLRVFGDKFHISLYVLDAQNQGNILFEKEKLLPTRHKLYIDEFISKDILPELQERNKKSAEENL